MRRPVPRQSDVDIRAPRRAGTLLSLWLGAACWLVPQPSAAEHAPPTAAPSPNAPDAAELLRAYFRAFGAKRLVSTDAAKVGELRALLQQAEQLEAAGHDDAAVLLLFELTEHPRFADYVELEELSAANYALGSALHALGAERSARVALLRVLRGGVQNAYFAPAFRRYVDVALAGEPIAPRIAELQALSATLPEDAQNELLYLQARERQGAGDRVAAKTAYERVSRHSRFYANAQYLLGAMASEDKTFSDAERHFCKIAGTGDDTRYSFYVDGRYFRIKDLARLGLGRVAHEQHRGDDAFYYYFQVPSDSPRLPSALFEGAYARYEAGDHETAVDLLDQLQARFPESAYADEAALLRGYVALAHCQFDAADRNFTRFNARFEPVVAEIDRILANPARREALYTELSSESGARARSSAAHTGLLALLRIDPEFNDLHERLLKLDGEAARAGQLPESFALIAARYEGSDRPRPLAAAGPTPRQELAELSEQLSDARRALHALNEQLDAMRGLGARESELSQSEADVAGLAKRVRALEERLDDARLSQLPAASATSSDLEVTQLLARDQNAAAQFERRVLLLRPTLVKAANERALLELRALRERLAGFLRRARIGRIDAVMGSKRKLEIQIESLAAGRFPAELRNPLLTQGFLNDDEEYWPFEGEDWPDEYLERYGDEAGKGAP
jgi:hypothetical protein